MTGLALRRNCCLSRTSRAAPKIAHSPSRTTHVLPRTGRSGNIWTPLWLTFLVAAASCSPTREEAPLPDTTAPSISILVPTEGSIVVDTVCVTIEASDDERVARVTLLVDGTTIGRRYGPPWIIPWPTGQIPDSSLHRLQAEAVDAAGNLSLSLERQVWVRHNCPPSVLIIWPPDQFWIDLDAPGSVWRCQASDPDEGPLSDDRISWRLDGTSLDQKGSSITPPPLGAGDHQLTVVATDSWGRSTAAKVSVRAFHYPDGSDPVGALEAFLCALRARDPDSATKMLAGAFTLFPPGATRREHGWTGETKAAALRALLNDSCLTVFTIAGRLGRSETFTWKDAQRAKIEIQDLRIHAFPRGLDANGNGAGTVAQWSVEASAARIFLGQRSSSVGPAAWQILAWWDLHGATWSNGAGPSWTEALQEALGRTAGQ